MFDFSFVQQHLGPLSVPLMLLSMVVCVIVFEKLVVLSWFSLRRARLNQDALFWPNKKMAGLKVRGLNLLMLHQSENKAVREEIAEIWLQQRRRSLNSGIRFLQVIAILAPLLGLLGTVLGLIQVFDDLAIVTGAIEPSMLAEGLGLAMHTTAAGLLIALPALAGAYGYLMWTDNLIADTEYVMNKFNFMLQGIDINVNDCSCDLKKGTSDGAGGANLNTGNEGLQGSIA
ncbi:MotA/TolQ/ExbB proton channel family protein [Litoribacillus peritrichatus]|uniref:MotA/TolQ/ExbB proton channel family protein n=1 Tax=Litoribacillus peritrichatus TaxID=718191 RepID=A0ABP7MIA0_9GAMM